MEMFALTRHHEILLPEMQTRGIDARSKGVSQSQLRAPFYFLGGTWPLVAGVYLPLAENRCHALPSLQ